KSNISRDQQIGQLPRHVAGSLLFDVETNHFVRPKIARDRISLPVIGELGTADDLQAAEFGIIPGANALQLAAHARISEISCPGQTITEPLKSGPVGDETLPKLIECVAPGIAKAAQVNPQLHRRRTQPPDAAAVQVFHAMRRFKMTVNVDRLVEIQAAVRPPA